MLFKSVITLTVFIASFSLSVNAAICTAGHGGSFCVPCSPGSFSPGNTGHCQPCPAGQDSGWSASSCGLCPAGEYSKGGTACMACPLGKFSSQAGSSGCCECCQGWKPEGGDFFGYRSTSCTKCSAGKSSNPGDAACSFSNHKSKTATCASSASGFCPATVPGGPSGLPQKKRSPLSCRPSYSACPHVSGRGGWDCVDTKNDAEMCGGCVSLDGTTSENEGAGQDCTAIPNVNIVKCKKGGCVIESCRKGFTQSEDDKSCVHVTEHPSAVEGALGSLFFPS